MYTRVNYKTKKALKAAVTAGQSVEVYQPGPFGPQVSDGVGCIEGPHYPAAHSWYASAVIKDGLIVSVK